MTLLRRTLLATGAALILPMGASHAQGDRYPNRPIRMIVPFAPGGTTDVVARLVAGEMAKTLGQQVTAENRSGAGGNPGADAIAKAAPDGYTIGIGTISIMAMNRSLYQNLPFDSLRDFTPLSLLAKVPSILIAHPSVPASTIAELVAHLKANPGKYSFASSGVGSTAHIGMELFKTLAGIQGFEHVPYRGTGEAMADLTSGRVQFMLDPAVTALQSVRTGRMKGLAVSTPQRVAFAPDIPSLAETFPGFDGTSWLGMVAPRGLPADVEATLVSAIHGALRHPDVVARFADLGAEPAPMTPAEFRGFIEREVARWEPIIRQSGAKVE